MDVAGVLDAIRGITVHGRRVVGMKLKVSKGAGATESEEVETPSRLAGESRRPKAKASPPRRPLTQSAFTFSGTITLQTLVSALGMGIGTTFMLLGREAASPSELRIVGGFLLVAGFCWLLGIQFPK